MDTKIERLADGSYRASYDAGRIGSQRPRGRKTFALRKDATAWLREREGDAALGAMGTPRDLTVSSLIEAWLASPKKRGGERKPSTVTGYRQVVKDHIAPSIGAVCVRDLREDQIEACIKAMKDKGLKPATQAQAWAIIHASLTWGRKKKKYRGENPADYADAPSPDRYEMKFLEVDEARRMLVELARTYVAQERRAAGHSVLYAPVLIALATGARLGEIGRLRWCDVDLKTGRLTILQAKTPSGVRPITLSPWALEPLKRHKRREQEMAMSLGLGWNEEHPVCGHWSPRSGMEVGGPLNLNSVSGLFRRWADRHGFTGVRFHDLRHTQVAMLIAEGVHPKVISERLGHASYAFTMNRYGHLLKGLEEQAAGAVPDLTALGTK